MSEAVVDQRRAAPSPSQPTAPSPRRPAITTPFWDGLLTGGLSLVGMALVLGYLAFAGGEVAFDEGEWIALALLVNSPHFMASYRVLYDAPIRLRQHPWATLVVPTGLLGVIVAVGVVERPGPILGWLVLVGSVYLAWHYAGQTWGMMATFSHLAGVRYTPRERWLLRSGPRALIGIHVLFALSGRLPPRQWVDPASYVAAYTVAFQLTCGLIVASFAAGAWAFTAARRRGEPVPLRAVLPWASLYLWYPFWYFVPGGFMWVQLSHALQYLAFPIRVDVNRSAARRAARAAERTGSSVDRPVAAVATTGQRRLRALISYLVCVGLGVVILHGPPLAAHAFGEGWWSTPDVRALLVAVTHCVGIHHYFVDGAIWHLRNDAVRRELFSHLAAGASAGPPADDASGPRT